MATDADTKPTAPAEPAAPESAAVEAPADTTVTVPKEDSSAPATAEAATPAPEQPTVEPPSDSPAAQLRALFPGTDVEVIEAVLASTAGDVDSAMETLLQLNDPEYKPNPEEVSQLELDEEFARQLAREDELAQAQRRVNAPSRSSATPNQEQPQQPLAYKPYVPRSKRAGPASPSIGSWQPPSEQPRQQQQEPERDELDQLTEQFSKFADQGKKLFGNFLNSAKEQIGKVDQMVQRSASPSSSSSQGPPPPPKPVHSDSWSIPSPLPRPDGAPQRKPTSSPMPDFLSDPSSSASARSQSPSPARPAASSAPAEKHLPAASSEPPSTVSAAPSTSASTSSAPLAASSSPAKPFQIPGLLPRQSFSLLDQAGGGGKKDGGTAAVKSPLGAPTGSKEEEKSHYSLGDDSEDDIDYVRSPFQDDD